MNKLRHGQTNFHPTIRGLAQAVVVEVLPRHFQHNHFVLVLVVRHMLPTLGGSHEGGFLTRRVRCFLRGGHCASTAPSYSRTRRGSYFNVTAAPISPKLPQIFVDYLHVGHLHVGLHQQRLHGHERGPRLVDHVTIPKLDGPHHGSCLGLAAAAHVELVRLRVQETNGLGGRLSHRIPFHQGIHRGQMRVRGGRLPPTRGDNAQQATVSFPMHRMHLVSVHK